MSTGFAESAWAPLRVRAFRLLWLMQLGSMIGTWMQNVGAQWLLVDEPGAATLVALVQAAAMLPVLILAMPAGALADMVDRRRLLVGVQAFQVTVGAALVGLTLAGRLSPAALLTITFLLGCGTTLTIPGYQAFVQDLVPRGQLRSVAGLNGVAMNLARAIGPPIAGVLVAQAGVVVVFALNALSYAAFGAVLFGLRRPQAAPNRLPERFGGALRAGARYVRHSPTVRRIVLRCLLFVVPGAALWALLPLVASRLLGLGAGGYGLLLGALGVGAVSGAAVLPRIGAWLSPNRLVLVAGLVFAAATAVSVLVRNVAVVVVVLVFAGLAWLAVLASLNGILQMFLPVWVRARGLSIYQMAFAGGQAIGSIVWGVVAQLWGLPPALLAAGVLLAAGAVSVLVLPLNDTSGLNRDPAVYWPQPHLEFDPALEDGPVLVTRTFTVTADHVDRFLAAWTGVRRSRLRTGATSCALYRDGADTSRFVEVSLYPTWAEHLRQHEGRLTGADRAVEEAAKEFTVGRPRVEHLFPADAAVVQLAGPQPDGP
ncbi:MFS transporter [Pseudonocardia asaccharolytica]|uniref:MFS transporter n=1 Tax=Pseudonocardia asaccharolytica DSM 44247 = NBRC 16224 TaxID=1123024 RepID=A0A511D110_9PSEU|nr:MFS transporter [Pseudonocardia asaccharolytica]GEL18480.1 MFS transporter [Pseudonocardia asaccharolytica DSM 44247 = NBRC 16224]